MKASELRIGNYLFDQKNRLCKVDKLSSDNYRALSINGWITTLPNKPIELTEEILLKCGFEKKIWKAKNSVYYELNKLEILLEDSYYINGVTYYKSGLLFEYHPKHLHQLQNLYFCLYGEELTINL